MRCRSLFIGILMGLAVWVPSVLAQPPAATAGAGNLVVTINGVRRATVPSVPKLGGVLLALPPDLEVLDLRFEAQDIVQSRAIALVK